MVRALMTATWLVQWIGVKFRLGGGLEHQAICAGSELNPCFGLQKQDVTMVSPQEAYELQSNGAILVDLVGPC